MTMHLLTAFGAMISVISAAADPVDHYQQARSAMQARPTIAPPAALTAALAAAGCAHEASYDLGLAEMQVGATRKLTSWVGSLSFVRCPNGDRFAIQLPGSAELGGAADKARISSALRLGNVTLAGRPAAWHAIRRNDGSIGYRLGWQTRGGPQAIVILYDSLQETEARAKLTAFATRLAPHLD